MSISINTLPYLFPVYSNNLIMNAVDTTADAGFTYEFEVYVNSVLLDTFRFPADPLTFDATIDLSTILSTWWESTIYSPTGATICEHIPDSLPDVRIRIKSYDSGNTLVTTLLSSYYWMFNGCANINEGFDITDYIISAGSHGNFLTKWATDRAITLEDKAYINAIAGHYGTFNSSFAGIQIDTYKDGVHITGVSETYSDYTKHIVNIDVSPSTLNGIWTDLITEDIDYYTVQERGLDTITPMKISLIKEYKHTSFFNFMWVNRLGGLDFFTAVKTNREKRDIEKKLLSQFVRQKPYYTDVQQSKTVLTQFMTVPQGEGLADLFSAPAVRLWVDGVQSDVRVINKDTFIRDRYPKDSFIQYEIEFEYNNRYFTQQF